MAPKELTRAYEYISEWIKTDIDDDLFYGNLFEKIVSKSIPVEISELQICCGMHRQAIRKFSKMNVLIYVVYMYLTCDE